ncbi:MAG: TldD/PmbA family protein [Alphaproteobacteria bacterium]
MLGDLIGKAKAAGADAADAIFLQSASLSHAQRLGEIERLEREESCDLGLRVFLGKRQAFVSSTDLSPTAIGELLSRAMTMAHSVPEDPYCGIADPDQLVQDFPSLDIYDEDEPEPTALIERAKVCEEAARSVPGVTNSEGAEASWSRSRVTLAASNGFAGGYSVSRQATSVSVLAGEGLAMERDYEFSTSVYSSDLEDAAALGKRAGEKAIRRLGARKPATGKFTVVFDPRAANSLLGHLAGAISGPSIARGTSFLKDKLGEAVFAPGIVIVDDPHRRRGLRSRPFDAEGVATVRRNIVEDGRLTSWILSLSSARQLGMTTTGHAVRGTSGPPGPATSNLYMEPGGQTPQELMADIRQGLYVTEMMGMGINGVTGDYSRGATGFWIQDGQITHPIHEATIAGNLKDMFRNLTPANDLTFRYGINAPTLRIEAMTVAGE